jgi:AcrR family transcriptional regulator
MKKSTKTEEKRKEITWALYHCLAEKGQEQVTIKDIARQAGLPHGVIHYYFKTKDEIISNLAEALVEKLSAMLEERLKNTKPGEAIPIIIDFIVEALIFDLKLNRVFYNLVQMSFERESLRQVIVKMLRNYRTQMEIFSRKYGADDSNPGISLSLVALTEGFALQLLVDPDSFTPETARQVISHWIESHPDSVRDKR